MKKHNRQMLALASALACLAPAFAQTSSVTMYGVVDAAVRRVDNGGAGSITSVISGGNSTSRLGFRGTEDLGSGYRASFQLEHGIALDTGTPASSTNFWDRLAFVALSSATLGEVRLGRDYVPTYASWVRFDPFSNVGVAGVGNLLANSQSGPIRVAFSTGQNTLVRSNNAVQYIAPAGLGGFEGGLMIAAGEGGTAANGQDRLVGARIGYAAGPLVVVAAVTQTRNDLTAGNDFKDTLLGASWDFSVVKVSAVLREFAFSTVAGVSSKQRDMLLTAAVPVGSVGQVKASYQKADLSGRVGTADVSANDGSQLGLGYAHALSKRTVAYANYARISNSGRATFTVPGGPAGLAAGSSSTGVEVGVRHTF